METKNRNDVQSEAISALLSSRRAGVAVSMGVGKTLVGLKHLKEMYTPGDGTFKALVVAPKKSIFQSWKDEMQKHGLDDLKDCITFSTYLSLNKQDHGYRVVYLDECHNLLPSHEPWLDMYKGIIVGLTGTPPKYERSTKGKLVNKFCPIKYSYFVDNAVGDGILNDYRVVVHMIPLGTVRNIQASAKKSWMTSELESYTYWSTKIDNAIDPRDAMMFRIHRMKAMMTFTSKEVYARKLFETITEKCILFANTQKQADALCPHSYHSENPNSDENLLKFKAGIIDRKSTRLNSSHVSESRMPSSA